MKKWYNSKTFWVNGIAMVATIIQGYTGFVVSPELQGLALTVANLFLRYVTKEEIQW